MGAERRTVVGIDLSGLSRATKGVTAAACLDLGDPPELLELTTFQPGVASDVALIDWVVARLPAVVAIDAPLTLPHSVLCDVRDCVRCVPGVADYRARDVDRTGGGMASVMLAAIMFRGIYLARRMRAMGLEVIETYPRAAYRLWGAEGAGGTTAGDAVAARVGSYRATLADERDAVAAALAAASYLRGDAQAIRGDDGVMWVPGGPTLAGTGRD